MHEARPESQPNSSVPRSAWATLMTTDIIDHINDGSNDLLMQVRNIIICCARLLLCWYPLMGASEIPSTGDSITDKIADCLEGIGAQESSQPIFELMEEGFDEVQHPQVHLHCLPSADAKTSQV